jgi:DNA-binding transcriptional regulator YiaG
MTPDEFRTGLKTLGFSLRAFASQVDVSERQVQRWAAGVQPVPRLVALLLNAWGRFGVP